MDGFRCPCVTGGSGRVWTLGRSAGSENLAGVVASLSAIGAVALEKERPAPYGVLDERGAP
jgi:hypothetical protein